MGLSFRKSVKLVPGVKVNFSSRGASLSVGVKGARMTVAPDRKPQVNLGTGAFRYRKTLDVPAPEKSEISNLKSQIPNDDITDDFPFAILQTVDDESCAWCRGAAERIYLASEIPKPPHKNCAHDRGCQCLRIPASRSDTDDFLKRELTMTAAAKKFFDADAARRKSAAPVSGQPMPRGYLAAIVIVCLAIFFACLIASMISQKGME